MKRVVAGFRCACGHDYEQKSSTHVFFTPGICNCRIGKSGFTFFLSTALFKYAPLNAYCK